MHYRAKGHIIRSENAAKSTKQASQYLVDVLKHFAPIQDALDFGCGKLRYAVHLKKIACSLTVVDSQIQIDRKQVVCDEHTSVREFVEKHWKDGKALSVEEFRSDKKKFDFALCANVLSAIPRKRRRKEAIECIRQHLRANGRCLFVCQYTNSFFCEQMRSKQVTKYVDGFIKGNRESASFYGLINLPNLEKLVESSDMKIIESWRHDQSGYVVATN